MGRWRASCSGSPAASRPTRPASSCGSSSRPATTCCRCRRAARSGSSGPRPSSRWRANHRATIRTRTWSAPTCSSIAPLTANTMAKLAHGLADDVLTEAALAHRGPILVAPAMNTRMWEHPATQANAATLRERGVELIGPEAGELAEGEVGLGRMTEPERDRAPDRGAARRTRDGHTEPARRRTRARQRRRHAGAARRRALPRQPLVRAGWASPSPPRRSGAAPT